MHIYYQLRLYLRMVCIVHFYFHSVLQIRVKCNEDDTIGDLKKLVAAQTGTYPQKEGYEFPMHDMI